MKISLYSKLKLTLKLLRACGYDLKRYSRFANLSFRNEDLLQLVSCIITRTHVLEKGLTMPSRKKDFGAENVAELRALVKEYDERYPADSDYRIHRDQAQKCLDLYDRLQEGAIGVPFVSREDFFSKTEAAFPEFSASRHSVRWFSDEPVSVEKVQAAVQMASSSPSSCNRQSTRVHLVTSKDQVARIMAVHRGNRGFGHLVDKLIIVTSDLRIYNSPRERNYPFVDAGMYAMNLLYALHYHKIGACTLNWCYEKEDDRALRQITGIPETETAVLIIAIGNVPEEFQIAESVRNPLHTTLTIH